MTLMIETLRRHAAATPERIAIDPLAGAPVSYAGLLGQVETLAAQLAADFPAGEAVALQRDHSAGTTVLELALLEAGVKVLSLPRFFTADQTRAALAASGIAAVFEDGEGPRHRKAAPAALPEGTARITFTSGPTGDPKGVCLAADHMLQVSRSSPRSAPTTPDGTLRYSRQASCSRPLAACSRRCWQVAPMSARRRLRLALPIPSGPISPPCSTPSSAAGSPRSSSFPNTLAASSGR